jgi:DNA-binding MarR family transcriptional regulator
MAPRTRWLDGDEQATWRSLVLFTHLLDDALDRQLQRDSGMSHAYYQVLVALSESDRGSVRMSDLAALLRFSPSRMTHAVASLERRGWIRREPCPTDRRGQLAVLTADGRRAIAAAAPGHVAEVRARVFDRLDASQVGQLRALCETLLAGLDPGGDG